MNEIMDYLHNDFEENFRNVTSIEIIGWYYNGVTTGGEAIKLVSFENLGHNVRLYTIIRSTADNRETRVSDSFQINPINNW